MFGAGSPEARPFAAGGHPAESVHEGRRHQGQHIWTSPLQAVASGGQSLVTTTTPIGWGYILVLGDCLFVFVRLFLSFVICYDLLINRTYVLISFCRHFQHNYTLISNLSVSYVLHRYGTVFRTFEYQRISVECYDAMTSNVHSLRAAIKHE